MPKLILRCNYLKNAPPTHLSNFITYIGTRDGVEKVSATTASLPATAKQKELIKDILSKIEDSSRMHEYYDYVQKPTRANASEFITQALENNLNIIAKKKNYIDYLANRPGAEKVGSHGLFSNEGEAVVLSKVAEEVAGHKGVIWTNVISLRREDAQRLGYDNAAQWQSLLRSRVHLLCENYKIDSRNLKWYAAFHNESHHPHVHLVLYSTDTAEGYLTGKGIDAMRSTYAHDIFRQDFMSLYERKTEQREKLKEQAKADLLFLLRQMQEGVCHNTKTAGQMQLLSKRLNNTKGKKVYGYLKADVKAIVNGIVDELAKEEKTAQCYKKWIECQDEILHFYKDNINEAPPLSEQKELKSIKNMVIKEALRYGSGYIYADDTRIIQAEEEYESRQENHADRHPEAEDDISVSEQEETDIQPEVQNPSSKVYAAWTGKYKEAVKYLYGDKEIKPDAEKAYELMKAEAEKGNAYAMHDMGKIYERGIGAGQDAEKASEWYKKSLDIMTMLENKKENACLEYRIGRMYQYGLGTQEDLSVAADWFSLASDEKHKYAMYSLGMMYLHGNGVPQNDEKAFELLTGAYEKGNPYAAYQLGRLYEEGRGTQKDMVQSEDCYSRAFTGFKKLERDSGDDSLLCRIGVMYLMGTGTEPDETEAEKYLTKAAEYKNVNAQYQLAKLYIRQETEKHKTGIIPDYDKIKKAVELLEEVSERGNTTADYLLGKTYEEGILTAKDMERAVQYFGKSAEEGNSNAQYRLGRIYLTDEWKNIGLAIEYLKLAAEQKNEYALYRLGKLYLTGEGIPKDIKSALNYLGGAAYLGNQYAQYILGKLYLTGDEIPQDKDKAYHYFLQAAEQGNMYAAYFIEHWDENNIKPDLLLMATRLMHHMENIVKENIYAKGGARGLTDRKLLYKIKSKKISQGHAADDHEVQEQTQIQ